MEDLGTMELSFFDFFAGAIISNAFVWFWNMAIRSIASFSLSSPNILTVISYFVYLLGGTVGSYLISLKGGGNYSKISLKSALSSWLLSLPLMLTFTDAFYLELSISILFCFLMGGIISAYLNIMKLRG
jgi:hypothetical protein